MPELADMTDYEYLRNLSERLMAVPGCFGTDQYDCDRLRGIAEWIEVSSDRCLSIPKETT